MGGCASTTIGIPKEKEYRRAIKLYEVFEVKQKTNLFNRNKCFESGESPLTLAAREGHEAVVHALISQGADVNKLDKNGRGPLHISVYLNDTETADILLANKASTNKYDDYNMTPLHIAAERGYKDMVLKLIANGADVNEDRRCLPPLVHAVAHQHGDCVKPLVQNGGKPNTLDAKGNSVLHVAVTNCDVTSALALLEFGADPYFVGRDNISLLCLSALNGCVPILDFLLQKGCDPNESREDGPPPLVAATVRGQSECVDVLLAHGAVVDCFDKKTRTALFNAVMAVVDTEKELFYSKYFSNMYRSYSKHDPVDINMENMTKCAMSLVQGGSDLTVAWERFSHVFPGHHGITFEEMVLCEVLIQSYGFHKLPKYKIRTFVNNLFNLREYGLVKLLFSAGVEPVAEDLYTLSVRGEESDRAIFKWVKKLRFNPRTLMDLCRKCIRSTLSRNILYLVEQIELPANLKEYVCIMDTEHYSFPEIS